MNCPNCKNENLKEAVFYNTGVDYCPRCLGVWFEGDELRQAKDEREKDLRWLDIDLWRDETKFHLSHSQKSCPRDSVPLYEVRYGDSGIYVDICNMCQGVWLERGEFKKIIDHLKAQGQDEMFNHYFANLVREGIEVLVGPEGLKEEAKDFVVVAGLFKAHFAAKTPFLTRLIASLPK